MMKIVSGLIFDEVGSVEINELNDLQNLAYDSPHMLNSFYESGHLKELENVFLEECYKNGGEKYLLDFQVTCSIFKIKSIIEFQMITCITEADVSF